MKPFNLEAAKAGKPVVTRDGRPVRILCFDARGDEPICGTVPKGDGKSDEVTSWFPVGTVYRECAHNHDLFMADEPEEKAPEYSWLADKVLPTGETITVKVALIDGKVVEV